MKIKLSDLRKNTYFRIVQVVALIILSSFYLYQTYQYFSPQTILVNDIEKIEIPTNQNFYYLLDAGHGISSDFSEKCGNKSVEYTDEDGKKQCFWEYQYNFNIRFYLSQMLDSMNIAYDFTNDDVYYYKDDPVSDLKNRVYKINEYNPSKEIPIIVFSIHGNANKDKDVGGFEVYVSKQGFFSEKYFYENKHEFSQQIANEMYQSYKTIFGTDHKYNYNKEPKKGDFFILTRTKTYAILTENEYFTNPEIRKKMQTVEFQRKVAEAHLLTILKLEERYE